ncbi:MAG: sulfotransferase domain-containing protein [Halopseudomonas sp.]
MKMLKSLPNTVKQLLNKEINTSTFNKFPALHGDYDVVIHIGAPKTGSSAIQRFLLGNRSELKKQGYYYPLHGLDPNGISGGHSEFGIAIAEGRTERAREIFAEHLAVAQRKKLTLLLSAESLFRFPKQLKEITGDTHCKIVSLFRDPLESIYSNYHQNIKRHYGVTPIEAFCRGKLKQNCALTSGLIFNDWIKAFSGKNVLVVGFDLIFFEKHPIEHFFVNILGIDNSSINSFKKKKNRVNQGYADTVLNLKRLLNNILDKNEKELNKEIDWCLQAYSDQSDAPKKKLQDIIPTDLHAALADKFKPSNLYLNTKIITKTIDDFLIYNHSNLEIDITNNDNRPINKLVEEIFSTKTKLTNYIKNRLQCCSKEFKKSPCHSQLAEAFFGLEIEQKTKKNVFFTANQIDILTSEKSSSADMLREIAISAERRGDIKLAFKTISRALQLRPNGFAIIAIHKRLKSKLN